MVSDVIYIIGAGGHGRVVADALSAAGVGQSRLVFRDGRPGLTLLGNAVAVPETSSDMAGSQFHVAVGSTAIRRRLYDAAIAVGALPLSVFHPASVIAAEAKFGHGILVAATAVVAPGADVGDGTIVNHGAIVDHDARVGSFCHIAPRAALGGGVRIGDNVLVGAGAVILPGLNIVQGVTIGAGAVVTRSIIELGTWVGNPARKLEK